jgi:hypothetical protein
LSGTGVHTISPASALPKIWEPVTIGGYTQPGAFQNTLLEGTNAKPTIQIDGSQAGQSADGLYIDPYTGSPGVVVKGLVINRFNNGIVVESDTTNSRIEGNFIGTDPSGTKKLGNRFMGVMLSPTMANSSNIVGGSTPAARNLISGNAGYGVDLQSDGTHVSGNLIGTQRDGKSPLGNDWGGVYMGGTEDTVGGATPSHANTIAFNAGDGIAGGGQGGILSNSVFSNGGLGIDLYGAGGPTDDGPTANDAGDVDGLQNKPSLGSAKTVSGKTTIKGTLNSRVGFGYTVQFFSNPAGTDEGARPIGQKTHVSVDGTGHASFTFSPSSAVAVGQTITATATNENTLQTSEFSVPRTVASS